MKLKYILVTFFICMMISNVSAQEKEEEIPAGWWKVPKTNTRFIIGGYVKADLIQDFNPIGNVSYFDVSTIPTDSSKGTHTQLQANEARLIFDGVTNIDKLKLETYIEGDFFGPGGSFRLRHAFAEVNERILVGQTWSTFMDEDIIPQDLDLEKPNCFAFVRQAQVRYKQPIGKSSYLWVALEQPYLNVQEPTQSGLAESFLPSLAARYRITKPWGHVQLSGFTSLIRFQPTNNNDPTYTSTQYGANISGLINFYKKDIFVYQVIGGQGVSQFRQGLFAAPNANDKLVPVPGYGVTGSVRHYWTPDLSTILVGNYGEEMNTANQYGSGVKNLFYATASMIWQFNKNAFVGVEYLRGGRQDKDNAKGIANRIQMSLSVTINNRSPYYK